MSSRVIVLGFVSALSFAVNVRGQTADNPLKLAKVGDFVEFTSTTTAGGQNSESTVRQTIKAMDPTSATIVTKVQLKGSTFVVPDSEQKVALNKPYDPTKPAEPTPDLTIEKLEEAREEITVRGKKYACTRIKVRTSLDQPTGKITTLTTTWYSKDVPLYGLVKTVTDIQGVGTTIMELSDSGRGK